MKVLVQELHQQDLLKFNFNGDLTINASLTSFNLDHFLIRRYVPDASQIIIEGFKPTDAVGPYIIKPDI
jgi:hypothetical protein